MRQITQSGAMPYAWTPGGTLLGDAPDGKTQALDPASGKPFNWGLPSIFRPLAWPPNKRFGSGQNADEFLPFIFTRSSEAQRARMSAAKHGRNSQDVRAARLTPGPFCACSSEAQRARMSAAKQGRNSQDLRAARLTPGPFCACSSRDYWQIAPNAPYPSTVWLKDGEGLLFSRVDGIFLADPRTRQLRQEASTIASGIAADMHSRFTLSRDNQSIFFILSGDEDDIWIGGQ